MCLCYGGHSASGLGICDDRLVIDLSLIRYTSIDLQAGTVVAGAGCTLGDIDHATWTKQYWEALHPYSAGGGYVNFMMDEGEERVKATYGDNYARLVTIKNKYDPGNLFRVNQNIKPGVKVNIFKGSAEP
jgi:FAD/FMN-containing dehydrogenase